MAEAVAGVDEADACLFGALTVTVRVADVGGFLQFLLPQQQGDVLRLVETGIPEAQMPGDQILHIGKMADRFDVSAAAVGQDVQKIAVLQLLKRRPHIRIDGSADLVQHLILMLHAGINDFTAFFQRQIRQGVHGPLVHVSAQMAVHELHRQFRMPVWQTVQHLVPGSDDRCPAVAQSAVHVKDQCFLCHITFSLPQDRFQCTANSAKTRYNSSSFQ